MIKLIIDSAADLSKEEVQKNGIIVLPLEVRFGETAYRDGVDMSSDEFFQKLEASSTLPKTSQLPPYTFAEAFEALHGEEAIVITLSQKLSGTYQSACTAAKDYPNVRVISSDNVSVGEGLLAKRALQLIQEEKLSLDEIADTLNKEKEEIHVIALLGTLEYLKRGGRISSAVAFFGELLFIKPVVEVKNGVVALIGKAKGSKNGNNKLREFVAKYNGINFDMPFCTAYSGTTPELLQKYLSDSSDIYGDRKVEVYPIGPTIGTHIGPGAIAVAFFQNK